MMATLSELTIHQSDALKLQQEKNLKDVELQQCYERMEQVRSMDLIDEIINYFSQGEPPSQTLELEWHRMNEVEHRRKTERKIREEVRDNFRRTFSIIVIEFLFLERT